MPAVTADTLTLHRIALIDSQEVSDRPVLAVTTAPQGLEGEGFPVKRAFAGINKAYLELIRNLKNPFSSVVLEAVIPSKNPNSERYKKIAYGSITMKADLIKLEEWKNLSGRK